MSVKELCRLCAKKDEFSKDLLDDSNKNILKLIQDFIQIVVYENDSFPTRICLNCEEKMVSFQLFILECNRVQDTFKEICSENFNDNIIIKYEGTEADYPVIKSEVKDEMTAEEIASALNRDGSLNILLADSNINNEILNDNIEDDNFDSTNFDNDNDDDNDDYMDNVAIATLKQLKQKRPKRKPMTEEDIQEFNKVLLKPNLKVRDFVKLQCTICEYITKSWSGLRIHYAKVHKTKAVLFCLCGFVIRSKSVLYKHVSDHKLESRKLQKHNDMDEEARGYRTANTNVKDYVKFVCNECQKEFSSWYTLRRHSERSHKTLPVVQCVCGLTLKSKSVMYKHIQDHKNPNVIACDKCPRVTKSVAAMNKHQMRHIPKAERKFTCSTCDKIFNTKDALKSHVKSHIPIEERKIYHCDVCNLKFTTRSSAASHKRVVHEKIKCYVCDLCGYACGTNGELRQHRAIHSDDKPYGCRKCPKKFKTYSNLKTHMDTHEDTSYECYICRRILNSRRTLRKHLLVHEDKCRHICNYCNKGFKRRQTLKTHMYTHTGDKPLTCKWCEERFAYASTLRSHRLRCHPDKMAAQSCNNYPGYARVAMEPDYIKNDLAAINVSSSVAKNEVEAL